MSRLLGVDLGERRIGVAIADPDGGAMPLLTLRRGRTAVADADAIQRQLAGKRRAVDAGPENQNGFERGHEQRRILPSRLTPVARANMPADSW